MSTDGPGPFVVRTRRSVDLAFSCPTCGGDRRGALHEGRRWLHLGSMPLVPLGHAGAGVTCASCRTVHPRGVLARATTATLATLLGEAVRVLTVMTVRTGDRANPALRAAAVRHIRTVDPTYDHAELERDLAIVAPADVEARVIPLQDELVLGGRERVVSGLVEVALAAHEVTPHQRWMLEAVASAWDISPLHLGGIISGLAAASSPAVEGPRADGGDGDLPTDLR